MFSRFLSPPDSRHGRVPVLRLRSALEQVPGSERGVAGIEGRDLGGAEWTQENCPNNNGFVHLYFFKTSILLL